MDPHDDWKGCVVLLYNVHDIVRCPYFGRDICCMIIPVQFLYVAVWVFLIFRAAAGAVAEPPDRDKRGLNRQTAFTSLPDLRSICAVYTPASGTITYSERLDINVDRVTKTII